MSAVPVQRVHSGQVVELRAGESLTFRTLDGAPADVSEITVTFEHKSGQRARARVIAPQTIVIARSHQSKL